MREAAITNWDWEKNCWEVRRDTRPCFFLALNGLKNRVIWERVCGVISSNVWPTQRNEPYFFGEEGRCAKSADCEKQSWRSVFAVWFTCSLWHRWEHSVASITCDNIACNYFLSVRCVYRVFDVYRGVYRCWMRLYLQWEKVIFECVGSLRIWAIARYVVRTMVSALAWVLCLDEWGNDSSEGESTCILPCLVFGRFSESIWEVTIFLRGLRSILDPPGHSPVNFEGRRLYSFKNVHYRNLFDMKTKFR